MLFLRLLSCLRPTLKDELRTDGDPKEKLRSRTSDWSRDGESNSTALLRMEERIWSEVTGVLRRKDPGTSSPEPAADCEPDESSAAVSRAVRSGDRAGGLADDPVPGNCACRLNLDTAGGV